MNTMLKRIVSMFLCFVLVAGYLPAGALAAETEETVVTAAAEATNEPSAVETAEEAADTTEETQTKRSGGFAGFKGFGKHNKPDKETTPVTEATVPVTEETVPETTEATEPVTKETVPETTEATVPVTEETEPETTEETESAMTWALPRAGVVDAAIFFSDLHAGKPNGGTYTTKESTLKNVLKAAKETGLTFSSVTSVGDLFAVNNGTSDGTNLTEEQADKDRYTGYIQEILGSQVTANYAWSDHDRTSDIPNVTGLVYGAGDDGEYGNGDDDNYYVYTISMSDMTSDTRYGVASTFKASKLKDFTDTMALLDPSKPVFIASHQPLHAKRNDNQYAYQWFEVINAAAKDRDIIFFWGHNHNYDEGKFYYYGVGDGMTVQNGSGTKSVEDIQFAYIGAGYLDPTTNNSQTRTGTVLVVEILENSIDVTTYNSNGVYTGSNALDVSVERQHEDDVTGGNETPDNTEPSQPETPDVTIVDASGNTVEAAVAVNNEAFVQEAVSALLTNAVAYDIDIEGEVGNIVITLPVPQGVENPAVYYVPGEGKTPVDMKATKNADGTVSFNTDHNSIYVVGEIAEDEGQWILVATTPGDTYYELAKTVEAGQTYLIASGSSGSVRLLKNDGTRSGGQTVSNNRITSSSLTTYEWTFETSGSGYIVKDSNGKYMYPYASYSKRSWSYSLKTAQTSGETVQLNMMNASTGAATLSSSYTSNSRSTTSYLTYNSGFGAGATGSNVYLFKKVTAAGSSTYAKMEGATQVVVGNTEYADDTSFLAALRQQIKVYKATDANGADREEYNGYTIDGTVDPTTAGNYTLTVKYGTVALGTVAVTVTAGPTLEITEHGEVVAETDVILRKNAVAGDKVQLGVEAFNGTAMVTNPEITWSIPEEHAMFATVDATGLVTFRTNAANFCVDATWVLADGTELTDRVQIAVVPGNYVTPNEGTQNFPEYDNPGAVRYDKTAEAVGNFSETGVAQLELSMTGIPYGGQPLDIVLILDRSSSMKNANRLQLTHDAAVAFVNALAFDTNGNPTNHNIVVADYHGGKTSNATDFGANLYTSNSSNNPYGNFTFNATYQGRTSSTTEVTKITGQFMKLNGKTAVNNIVSSLGSFISNNNYPSGTDYDHGLQYARVALKAARDAGSTNKQFVVMMTDGVPTHLRYEGSRKNTTNTAEDTATFPGVTTSLIYGTDGNNDMRAMFSGANYENRGEDYGYEYVSGLMKQEGVTIYTVALGLNNTNSAWPAAGGLSQATATQVNNAGSIILNDISGPAYETTRDTGSTITKKYDKQNNPDGYFFNITDGDTTGLNKAFTDIAGKISEAATNIVVTDKITEDYTMIFGIPKSAGTDDKAAQNNAAVAAALADQDLYIEVVNYTLNADHDRTGTPDTVQRVYLKDSNGATAGGTYSAASDKNGTAAPALVMQQAESGKPAYWSIVPGTYIAGANEVVVKVGETTYKFMQDGKGTHNVTAGAYAFGNIDLQTNMSNDLVIVTPYFAYSAATKMLVWTFDKVEEFKEIALRYFLYLDNSATEIGRGAIEKDAGTYDTNVSAYAYYTNHLGEDCRLTFPIPKMTWNGAQVSYVFYLVNEEGQPINKAGQVVDFANATYITQVFTEAVVWNDTDTPTVEGIAYLDANWFASDKLPEGYDLYDNDAYYELKVYEDHEGNVLDNYFKIDGGEANGSTISTTKVYNTKAGDKYSAYDTYDKDDVASNFDFANTTVAFAVVWTLELVPDAVVVDYGLDVLINVTQNDLLQNHLTGISKAKRANVDLNSGIATTKGFTATELTFDSGHYAKIENDNQIRFSQEHMKFNEPAVFYYETESIDYKDGNARTGYMHSTVTVIPATTIYYEDEFVDLKTYNANFVEAENLEAFATGKVYYTTNDGRNYEIASVFEAGKTYYTINGYTDVTGWDTNSVAATATQDQDRPGESKISAALDADNNYGYDSAYKTYSTYSMGSAAKVNVRPGRYATASFSFYGTGFDVISLTSDDTGTFVVQVFDETGNRVRNATIDTFYGMNENGQLSDNNPDAIYQVPVIKLYGLDYGKYTATITASYSQYMDHTTAAGYDLYLDAIRIYDPTGNENKTANDAYAADGEAWPVYEELRDNVIKASGTSFYTAVEIDAFETDKTYYVKNISYNEVTGNFAAGTTYYTMTTDEDGKEVYTQAEDLTAFEEGETYYVQVESYVEAEGAYQSGTTYYVDTAINGVVFIDCNDATSKLADYISYGPNNELYLAYNQAIAFTVDVTETMADIQLGIKIANGNTVTYKINGDSYTVNTATDMYYSIWEYAKFGGVVTIENVSGGILSLTNIKTTFTEQSSTNGLLRMSGEDVGTALMMLRRAPEVEEEIPEATDPSVPETTDPSVPETTVPEETEPTEPAKPDNSELKAAVEEAKKLKDKDYTKESFKALETARKAAEKVLKNKNATQAQIDEALADLNAAVEALEAKPDSSKLQSAVDAAKKLKEKDYTKESFKALETARKAAEKVLKNKNATQAQIDEALEELNEAMANLKAASKGKPGKKR